MNENTQAYSIDNNIEITAKEKLNYVPIYVIKDNLIFDVGIGDFIAPTFDDIEIATESAGIDVNVRLECDYTDIFINYKEDFAELLQLFLARRIIVDCLYSNEFNTITESNRKNWTNLNIYFSNLIDGYEFTDEKGNYSTKSGVITNIFKQFEGIDEVCFPKLRKIVL